MILCIVAIMLGQVNGARDLATGIGADMIVQPPNSTFLSGISGAPVPARSHRYCRSCHTSRCGAGDREFDRKRLGGDDLGYRLSQFQCTAALRFLAGTPFQGPNDVIVDDYFARSDKGHHVGDTITILNHQFRICGIVEHGKGGRKFLPIPHPRGSSQQSRRTLRFFT